MKRNLLFYFIFIIIILISGCKKVEYQATRCKMPIKIDGSYNDWLGHLTVIEKKNISAGFQYDDSFFYICLVTRDLNLQRQVMTRGLLLWMDSKKDEQDKIGIKYPLGFMRSEMSPRDFMGRRQEHDPQKMAMIYERRRGGRMGGRGGGMGGPGGMVEGGDDMSAGGSMGRRSSTDGSFKVNFEVQLNP